MVEDYFGNPDWVSVDWSLVEKQTGQPEIDAPVAIDVNGGEPVEHEDDAEHVAEATSGQEVLHG